MVMTTARSSITMMGFMAFSLATGLFLEIALAWRYGLSDTMDAYRIASIMLIFGVQIFFVQLFPNMLVPFLTALREETSEEEAWRTAFRIGIFLLVAGLPGIIAFVFYPHVVVGFLGPGLPSSASAQAEILVTGYAVVFMAMAISGVVNSILYINNVFWIPQASQILMNACVILSVLFPLAGYGPWPLAVGAVSGSCIGLLLSLNKLRQLKNYRGLNFSRARRREPLFSFFQTVANKWRALSGVVLPLTVMMLSSQWGFIAINRTLSELGPGSLATYGFALRCFLLVGIIPLILRTVYFPRLSKEHYQNKSVEFVASATRTTNIILISSLPVTLAMIIMRDDIVAILFGLGATTHKEVLAIADVILIIAFAAPLMAVSEFFSKVCFAQNKFRTPAFAAIVNVSIITFLVPWAAGQYEIAGIGFIVVAAEATTAGFMSVYVILTLRSIDVKVIYFTILRFSMPLVAMAGVMIICILTVNMIWADNQILTIIRVVIPGTMGIIALFLTSLLFRVAEVVQVFEQFHLLILGMVSNCSRKHDR
jgi:putative peptidoglycan lipid II flippase